VKGKVRVKGIDQPRDLGCYEVLQSPECRAGPRVRAGRKRISRIPGGAAWTRGPALQKSQTTASDRETVNRDKTVNRDRLKQDFVSAPAFFHAKTPRREVLQRRDIAGLGHALRWVRGVLQALEGTLNFAPWRKIRNVVVPRRTDNISSCSWQNDVPPVRRGQIFQATRPTILLAPA